MATKAPAKKTAANNQTTGASVENLTMGEIAAVEEISGMSIDSLGTPGVPKARLMIALATVFERRKNPKFTVAEAESMDFKTISEVVGLDTDE